MPRSRATPADGPQLAPAIRRVIKRTGKVPRTVTADRSYGEKAIEDDPAALGVRHVVTPRKGRPGKARQAAERRPAFRRHVKVADRLRRPYQHPQTAIRMGPDRRDGTEGARTWAGYGVLAHNLVKISALAS